MNKPILLILLLAVALTAVWLLLRTNAGQGMHAVKTDLSVTSKAIATDFYNDRAAANEKYLNKTVSLSGEVRDISTDYGDSPVLILDGGQAPFGVRCHFDPVSEHERKEFHRGEVLNLKCVCTGYVRDVVMKNCVEH